MTVRQHGTDSSGRPIYASDELWAVWLQCCDELGFTPTIVQGGWLKDAAAASAQTHAGDALDVRIRDRTPVEREQMIDSFRRHALAYWERYPEQGFDLHAHMVPGPWASPAPQALDQWNDYLNGRDGLARHRPDYHPRPSPLVTTPPEEALTPDDLTKIRAIVKEEVAAATQGVDRLEDQASTILGAVRNKGANSWSRDKDLKALVKAVLAEVQGDK